LATYLAGSQRGPPNGLVRNGAKTFVDVTPRFSCANKISSNTKHLFHLHRGLQERVVQCFRHAGGTIDPSRPSAWNRKSSMLTRSASIGAGQLVQLQRATFLYKYKNQQVASGRLVNGVPLPLTRMPESRRFNGADFEGKVRPVPELTVSVGISRWHTKIDSFPDATLNVPAPGNAGTVSTLRDVGGEPAAALARLDGIVLGHLRQRLCHRKRKPHGKHLSYRKSIL